MSKSPSSILIRAPNWIGDQIMAYPFFHYLRRAYPRARIVSACLPWVESIQFRNLVTDVAVLPKPYKNTFMAKLDAIEAGAELLRKMGPWDLGVSMPNSFSSAWLFFRAGVRVRRGYRTDGRGILLNEGLRWNGDPAIHRAEAYVNLLVRESEGEQALPKRVKDFWGVPPENDLDSGIPGVFRQFEAERAWPGIEPVAPPEGNYWVLAPGSVAESRRWPVERFASLARQVADETGWSGVVVGGPAEAPLAATLCEDRSLKLQDQTAQGPVSCYWKIFRHAKFTVTNDSGLAHVASLCGSNVQIVWGAGDPRRTTPIGPGKVAMTMNPVDCWPCERNTCTKQTAKIECLIGIQSEAVWKEIKSGLRF